MSKRTTKVGKLLKIYFSGVKSAAEKMPDQKATPQQWRGQLNKQKGVAGKELNAIDFDKMGNKAIGKEEVNAFIEAERPRINIAEARNSDPEQGWLERAAAEDFMIHDNPTFEELADMSSDSEGMETRLRIYVKNELDNKITHSIDKKNRERNPKLQEIYDDYRSIGLQSMVDNTMGARLSESPVKLNFELQDNIKRRMAKGSPEILKKYADDNYSDDMLKYKKERAMESTPEMGYQKYKLSGGDNYREIYFNLESLPSQGDEIIAFKGDTELEKSFTSKDEAYEYVSGEYRKAGARFTDPIELDNHITGVDSGGVRQGHMHQQPNNMAWARVTERKGENGERVLQIEEIQSDAAGSKELKKMLPKNWRKSVMEGVMKQAQDEGFDGVTWAKNAKQVDSIEKWGAIQEDDYTYFITPEGKKVDAPEFSGTENLEDLVKQQKKDLVRYRKEAVKADEKMAKYNNTSEEYNQKRQYERLEQAIDELDHAEEKLKKGWTLKTEKDVEKFTGGEGQQRVIDQYTTEMPKIAKEITGEDVGSIVTDGHELNYVSLKNKDTGEKRKLPPAKFWSAIPVAATAIGLGAGGSEKTHAMGISKGVKLASLLKDSFVKANLNPNDITIDADGSIKYPELTKDINGNDVNSINELSNIGAGDVRREVAIHNDEVMGGDFKGEFGDDLYHGTGGDIESFNKGNTYLSDKPDVANDFAMYKSGGNSNVIQAKSRGNNLEVNGEYKDIREAEKQFGRDVLGLTDSDFPNGTEIYDYAKSKGFDGVTFNNVTDDVPNSPQMGKPSNITVPLDTKNIRSKNAAFDRQFKDSSNLLGEAKLKPLAGVAAVGTGTVLSPLALSEIEQVEKLGARVIEDVGKAEVANKYLHMRAEGGGADAEKATQLIPQLQQKFDSSLDGVLEGINQLSDDTVNHWFGNNPEMKALIIGAGKGMKDVADLGSEAYMNLTGDEQGLAEQQATQDRNQEMFGALEEEHPLSAGGGEFLGQMLMSTPAFMLGGAGAANLAGQAMPRMLAGTQAAAPILSGVRNVGGGMAQGATWGAVDDEALAGATEEGALALAAEILMPKIGRGAKQVFNKKEQIADLLMQMPRGAGY